MGSLQRSAASLGFYGDDLDPAEITARLGGQPTICVRKDDTWLTASGAKKVAQTGSWRIVAEQCEPADLDNQIRQLLLSLSNDTVAWRTFASLYRGRIFAGLFLGSSNEGLTLHPETLAMIGERGLVLDLDIYGCELPD